MGRQHGERKDNSPPKKAAKIDTFSAKGINFLFSHLRMTLTFKKYKGRNSDDFKYLRICSMLILNKSTHSPSFSVAESTSFVLNAKNGCLTLKLTKTIASRKSAVSSL